MSLDQYWPIRDQYSGHVISIDQSEVKYSGHVTSIDQLQAGITLTCARGWENLSLDCLLDFSLDWVPSQALGQVSSGDSQ